jgi:hypothetical protein
MPVYVVQGLWEKAPILRVYLLLICLIIIYAFMKEWGAMLDLLSDDTGELASDKHQVRKLLRVKFNWIDFTFHFQKVLVRLVNASIKRALGTKLDIGSAKAEEDDSRKKISKTAETVTFWQMFA